MATTLAEMVVETARYARQGPVESMRALIALREVLAPEAERVLAKERAESRAS